MDNFNNLKYLNYNYNISQYSNVSLVNKIMTGQTGDFHFYMEMGMQGLILCTIKLELNHTRKQSVGQFLIALESTLLLFTM